MFFFMIYNDKKVFAIIYSYTYCFHRCAKWLYLNDVDYELIETNLYRDGLMIIIYEQKTKEKRRLSGYFMAKIFPVLRDIDFKQYNEVNFI